MKIKGNRNHHFLLTFQREQVSRKCLDDDLTRLRTVISQSRHMARAILPNLNHLNLDILEQLVHISLSLSLSLTLLLVKSLLIEIFDFSLVFMSHLMTPIFFVIVS